MRVLSFEQIRQLCGPVSAALLSNPQYRLSAKVTEKLQERQQNVQRTVTQVWDDQACLANRSVSFIFFFILFVMNLSTRMQLLRLNHISFKCGSIKIKIK